MQKSYLDGFLVLSLAAMVLGVAFPSAAQEREDTTPQVRIDDLELDQPLSPKYQDSTNSAAKRDQEWLEITLAYETRGGKKGWVDELTIEWAVAIIPRTGKPLLLKHTETYLDVQQGEHHATVYVRPNIVERYCGAKRAKKSQVAVYVQVKAGNSEPVKRHFTKTRVPEGWWNSKAPNVVTRDDELLSKAETPFAPLDYDFYEHLRTIRQGK